MADEGALEQYADKITWKIVWAGEDGNGGINGHSVANLLWHGPNDVRQEVVNAIAAPILDALKNRAEGSQSVFDELRYAIREIVLPNLGRARLIKGKDDPNGAIYAVSNTSFKHVAGGHILAAGTAAKLWGDWPDVIELPYEQVVLLAKHLGGKLYIPPPPAVTIDYTILKGDTLPGIATAHKITADAICKLNPSITDRNNLTVGVVIKLPKV